MGVIFAGASIHFIKSTGLSFFGMLNFGSVSKHQGIVGCTPIPTYPRWKPCEFLLGCPLNNWVVVSHIVYFHPDNWGRWTHFDEHIFQMGGSTTKQLFFVGVSKEWLSMTPSNQTFPRIAGLVVAITIAKVLRFLKGGGWNLVGYINGWFVC